MFHKLYNGLRNITKSSQYNPMRYMSTIERPTKLRLAVLDGSGTLVDPGVYAPSVVFQDVFKEFKVPISMAEAREPMGREKKHHIHMITTDPSVKERWKNVYDRYPTSSDVDNMYELFKPMQLIALEKYGGVITGTLEALHTLKKRDLLLGFSTGFNREMVNKILELNPELSTLLDTTITADELPRGRPAPYMVYKNMIDMDVMNPYEVVKIDDTEMGIHEGNYAKCWTIAVSKYSNLMAMTEEEVIEFERTDPEGFEEKHYEVKTKLKDAGAHFVVDDITKVPNIILTINDLLKKSHTPDNSGYINVVYYKQN